MSKVRTKRRRASAEEFTAMMGHYGLRSNEGAKRVAEILDVTPQTLFTFYSKGILRTELQLIELRLTYPKWKPTIWG